MAPNCKCLLLACLMVAASSLSAHARPYQSFKLTPSRQASTAQDQPAKTAWPFRSSSPFPNPASSADSSPDPASSSTPSLSSSDANTATPGTTSSSTRTTDASPATDAAAPAVATTSSKGCPPGSLAWSNHCWHVRDSNDQLQGPGSNTFSPENVHISSSGQLVLQVQASGQSSSCCEVFLDTSLGFGDYIWDVETDPTSIHHNLVASPFIYQDTSHEFDVEYARWGQADIESTQYVVQPHASSPPHRFNVAGRLTHRLRWSGGDSPEQLMFETFTQGGTLLRSYTGQTGNNFYPGGERVHINHWIFQHSPDLPAISSFVVNCFQHCPLGQEAICSAPPGTKPHCGRRPA